MTPDLTRGVLILVAVLLVGYDVVALMAGGPDATVSRVCLRWAEQYPLIPFAGGVLVGHLLAAQTR